MMQYSSAGGKIWSWEQDNASGRKRSPCDLAVNR
jgi:hypothetical protein